MAYCKSIINGLVSLLSGLSFAFSIIQQRAAGILMAVLNSILQLHRKLLFVNWKITVIVIPLKSKILSVKE